MKRKSNIVTTLALVFSILVIMLLPLPVAQAANFTVSKSNVSIENGKDSTITINAPTHTGRLDIVSSNSAVATVNSSNLWVENNSKTIVISAKGVGTATITIKGELYDSSTDTEEDFSKTINVTVTKSSSSGQTNTGGTSGGTQSGGTTNNNQSSNTGSSNTGSSNTGGSNTGGSNTGSSNTGSSNTGNSNTGTSTSGTQKPSSTSKPSSSQANTKPSNSSAQVSQSHNVQSTAATELEQNSALEQKNEEQNEAQEVEKEEVENVNTQEAENNLIQEDLNNAKINTTEQVNREVSKGKIIIISVIGIIAFIIMLIGIGVSKNIFKK